MTVVRSLTTLALVAGMAAVAWAGSAPAGRGAAKEEILPLAPAAVADKGLEILWKAEFIPDPGTTLGRLWLRDKYLVACGSDLRIYAINAATGVRLWSQGTAKPFQTAWPPALDKDNLWVATTTQLLGIDGVTGRIFQTINLDFAPAGHPVANGVYAFVPDAKGWLQAVSLLPQAVPWGRWTEDSVTAGPVLDASLVFFASQTGMVYASAQNVRRVVWEYKTEGAVVGDLARTDTGLVLIASLDYSLYAIQGTSGRMVWRYNAGEPIRATPHPAGNQVFIFTREAGLTALDAANGRMEWTLAEGADFIAADPKVVYVRSRSGDIVGVDRPDGKVRFTLTPLKDAIVAVNDGTSGVIYVALPGGQAMAVAPKGRAEEAPKKAEPGAESPAAPAAPPAPAAPAPG